MGMGFPETARKELMTPTALCRGGAYFATRQRAGFFVRVDQTTG